jgi:hypothetical protein
MKKRWINIISGKVNPDFFNLFLLKEGKELLGKKYKNFWILLAILFGTFLTIGFANGSLEYLQKKMSDPFVNWVSVEVPFGRNNVQIIVDQLQTPEIKQKYELDTITGYFELMLQLTGPEKNNSKFFMGRSISAHSPIQKQVLSGKNFVQGRKMIFENDYGLILTQDIFEELGYNRNSSVVFMSLSISDTLKLNVPVPIIAVVQELPGLADFAFTPYFYYQRNYGSPNPFRIDKYRTINFSVKSNKNEIEAQMNELQDSLFSMLNNSSFNEKFGPRSNVQIDSVYMNGGLVVEINFFPEPDEAELKAIYNEIVESEQLSKFQLTRIYNFDFNYIQNNVRNEFHLLSVYFEDLNNIREFKNYLKLEHDMEIDMSLIEAKENYNFISRLTRIISVILIAFSIFSLSLFTSNVFVRHVEKIGMNLGTFKAFGLNNRVLKKIYLLLIFSLLLSAIVISLILAWILGELGIINLVLSILDYKLESNQDFFNLGSYWTLIFVAIILTALYAFLNRITNNQLKKTPGDLIYGRD